jgi:hypothetical protein
VDHGHGLPGPTGPGCQGRQAKPLAAVFIAARVPTRAVRQLSGLRVPFSTSISVHVTQCPVSVKGSRSSCQLVFHQWNVSPILCFVAPGEGMVHLRRGRRPLLPLRCWGQCCSSIRQLRVARQARAFARCWSWKESGSRSCKRSLSASSRFPGRREREKEIDAPLDVGMSPLEAP